MTPTRKETPDLLGEILGSKPVISAPAEVREAQPASAVVAAPPEPVEVPGEPAAGSKPRAARKPASQPAETPAPQSASAPEPAPPPAEAVGKVKATFYLSQEALDALEGGQLQLRRLARPKQRTQVSKSLIVEQALLIALRELTDRQDESQLAAMLVSQ